MCHVPQTQRIVDDYEHEKSDRKTADPTADIVKDTLHSSRATKCSSSNYDHQDQDEQNYAFADDR